MPASVQDTTAMTSLGKKAALFGAGLAFGAAHQVAKKISNKTVGGGAPNIQSSPGPFAPPMDGKQHGGVNSLRANIREKLSHVGDRMIQAGERGQQFAQQLREVSAAQHRMEIAAIERPMPYLAQGHPNPLEGFGQMEPWLEQRPYASTPQMQADLARVYYATQMIDGLQKMATGFRQQAEIHAHGSTGQWHGQVSTPPYSQHPGMQAQFDSQPLFSPRDQFRQGADQLLAELPAPSFMAPPPIPVASRPTLSHTMPAELDSTPLPTPAGWVSLR